MYDLSRDLAELLEQDNRYKAGAYEFVFDALGFAQNVLNMGTETVSEPLTTPRGQEEEEEDEPEGPQQHVSGQELCEAIRQFALHQYGFMAKTVLNSWGIHATGDFGEIVFNLITYGKMRRTKHDCREDFNDVYDFETAFQREFKIAPSD